MEVEFSQPTVMGLLSAMYQYQIPPSTREHTSGSRGRLMTFGLTLSA